MPWWLNWWRKKEQRRALPERFELPEAGFPYGLHPDYPVLCGGGVEAEIDYLERLRCPSGTPICFQRQGSLQRNKIDYLNRRDVALAVSHGTRRRMGDNFDVREIPLDAYLFVCECGEHHGQLFMDMYFRGPELPIETRGWTLIEGVSPAEQANQTADCPYCAKELRTPTAKQCRFCKMDWHDPNNVFSRD